MPKPLRHLLLLASLWLGLASAALAADLITERAWFEDKTGALSFEQIKQQEFRPYQGVLSRGIGKGVIWLRLTFDPTVPTTDTPLVTDRAVLRVRPVYLDHVSLYDPLQDLNKPKQSGDFTPVSQDEYQSLNFNFVVPKGSAPRDLYLRVESTSTRMIEAQAFTLAKLQREDQGLLVFSGLYLGIGALFLFWAVTTWLTTRDRIVFAFIFSQAAGLGIGFTVFGYGRLWLSDHLGAHAVSELLTFTAIASVMAACWFYLRLISEFKPPRLFVLIFQVCLVLQGLAVVIFFTGDTRTAITFNWGNAVFLPVVAFVSIAIAKGWREPDEHLRLLPRWVLLGYFGVNLLILLAAGSAGFGLLPQASAFNVYAPLTNGIVSGALAVAFLQYRMNLSQRYQNQLRTALAVSQKSAEQEREYRLDQDRLLTMLAHEVKTPLSVISVALGTRSQQDTNRELAKNAIRDIRDIIDHCLQVDTLDSPRLPLSERHIVFSEILEEVYERLPGLKSQLRIHAPQDIQIKTDPRLLRIIVFNLLDNAQRYGDPEQLIEIEISEDLTGAVTLSVSNAAGSAGFPDSERIFEKYYRAAGAHRYSGTGLGLYLSRGLAQKLGGTLRYAVADSKIRVTLCLPSRNNAR